jgi:hypothetical protein
MKSIFYNSFLFLLFFCACTSGSDRSDTTATSENDVDAARNFIRMALDGNYDKAKTMIVNDSQNTEYLSLLKRIYNDRMDPETKRNYREASINIHNVRQVNDNESIINYSNSFRKKPDSLKVVRLNDEWRIDLKYSFSSPTKATP